MAPCYLGGIGRWKRESVWHFNKTMGTRKMDYLDLSVCAWNTGVRARGSKLELAPQLAFCWSMIRDWSLHPDWLLYLFSLSDIHVLVITNNFHQSVQKWCARHITMLLWKWTCEYCVNIWKILAFRRTNTVASNSQARLNSAGMCLSCCIYIQHF